MPIPCTRIPEIKAWSICDFNEPKTKKFRIFKIRCAEKKIQGQCVNQLKICKFHAQGYQKSNHGTYLFLGGPKRKNFEFSKFPCAEKKIQGQRVNQLKICQFHAQGYQKSKHGPFVILTSPKRKNFEFSKFVVRKKKYRDSVLIS